MLGATLNQMLDRIEESVERERRFVDRASHELRTRSRFSAWSWTWRSSARQPWTS